MARPSVPTIPDESILFFEELLYKQVENMFEWEGLPSTVPADYLERNLVRFGYVLYYEREDIGQDVLRCTVQGWNRHGLPTQARTFTPNTVDSRFVIERNIKRLTDGKTIDFDPTKDGVLIANMAYGQSVQDIVKHYARRMALAQQAIDTNLMWANIPYIFQVSSDETRLSIERMFSKIFEGEPFIIADKELFMDNKDRTGVPTGIPFITKDLMDVFNEINMKFREAIGFNTAGVDKAERVNTLEIQSNDQHTRSVLEIMLKQRRIACEEINEFFGESVSVDLVGANELPAPQGGEEEDGADDGGTGALDNEDEL